MKGRFKTKTILAILLAVMLFAGMFAGCADNNIYTITYSWDGESYEIEVQNGDLWQIDLNTVTPKTGYEFTGLFDSEEGGTQYTSSNGVCIEAFSGKSDLVLYPHFRLIQYTISLNYGEGSGNVSSVTAEYDGAIPDLPANITISGKDYYEFSGWYTKENGNGICVAGSDGKPLYTMNSELRDLCSSSNVLTLYAAYSLCKYAVTLHFGGSYGTTTIQVTYGTAPIDMVYSFRDNNGYAVLSWSLSSGGTPYTGLVTSAMDLYALEWAPCLTFDTAGGDDISHIIAPVGETITLPTPTREYYIFQYWMNSSGTQVSSPYTMSSSSETITAVWSVFYTGDGTSSNPYTIGTADQFEKLADSTYNTSGTYFQLVNDISLNGISMDPISTFYANLDGDGHTLSNWSYSALYYKEAFNVGLISTLSGAVSNIIVADFNVSISSEGAGDISVGSLAGENIGTISNCIFKNNTISATHDYAVSTSEYLKTFAGGAVGQNAGTINNSSAISNSVIAEATSVEDQSDGHYWGMAGGMVGYNSSKIIACFAQGNSVSGTTIGGKYWAWNGAYLTACAGGLVGYVYTAGTVTYSFANGNDVTTSYTALHRGEKNCNAYTGQVVAETAGAVSNCYCLISDIVSDIVGQIDSGGSSNSNDTVSSGSKLLGIEAMVSNGWHTDENGDVVPTTI